MIIVLIIALVSQVGGSPKYLLVETKDEHKEAMNNNMDDDDSEYYSGSYEYEYRKNL